MDEVEKQKELESTLAFIKNSFIKKHTLYIKVYGLGDLGFKSSYDNVEYNDSLLTEDELKDNLVALGMKVNRPSVPRGWDEPTPLFEVQVDIKELLAYEPQYTNVTVNLLGVIPITHKQPKTPKDAFIVAFLNSYPSYTETSLTQYFICNAREALVNWSNAPVRRLNVAPINDRFASFLQLANDKDYIHVAYNDPGYNDTNASVTIYIEE